jgi:hypothetical protein
MEYFEYSRAKKGSRHPKALPRLAKMARGSHIVGYSRILQMDFREFIFHALG